MTVGLSEKVVGPLVRLGEGEIAGRRIVARLLPGNAAQGPALRFDPVERRFVPRPPRGPTGTGPPDSEPWRDALRRAPFGPVLVGPGDPDAEPRGSYGAAAAGARLDGRGVYLLDPSPEDLSESQAGACVALFLVLPGAPPPAGLPVARARGLAAGVLVALLPDWTEGQAILEEAVEKAAGSGAGFAAGIVAADDGAARRTLVEARAELDPQAPEDFFERVHHAAWVSRLETARRRLEEAGARRGLSPLPPRAVGSGEPRGNARAAGRLEELADALARSDEHQASILRAAVRWIDESQRDLAAIAREGNFRKIFPFPAEVVEEADRALRERP